MIPFTIRALNLFMIVWVCTAIVGSVSHVFKDHHVHGWQLFGACLFTTMAIAWVGILSTIGIEYLLDSERRG